MALARPPAGLTELIAPIALDSFLTDYWEDQVLVVHREQSDFYVGLLTLDDIDAIFANSSLHDGDLRLVAEGQETSITELVPEELEGKINGLELMYARYREGATLNLTFLHERWPPLAALCRALATQLSASVHGNVYLTPRGTRGLTPHHDTHDVFVLQLYGAKAWNIYPTQTRIPLRDHHYMTPSTGPGEPVQQFVLRQGDLAYLPRGTVHAATAHEDDASLHLTIGVSPMVWAHVIRTAVERVMVHDERFRFALPPGFAVREELQESAAARLRELLGVLTDEISPAGAVAEMVDRTRQRRQPVLAGHLLDLEALPSVTLTTRLRRRPDLDWRLTKDDEEVHLEFHGKRIDLPEYVEDEIAYMSKADEFTGADIPGSLDDPGRLVLIQKLLEEGFLTVT